MSTNIFETGGTEGLTVTRFSRGAALGGGAAYQFTISLGYVQLSTDQVLRLIDALSNDIPAAKRASELSIRDHLASAALTAIYASQTMMTDRAAVLAYEQADEMLKARSVNP